MSAARAQVDALLAVISDAAHAALDEYEANGGPVPSLSSLEAHPMDIAEKQVVTFRKAIARLEGACEQLCTTLAPPDHTMMNRAQAFDWACLRVAARYSIADRLQPYGEKGAHVDELAKEIGFPAYKLAVILRLLATRHCFQEVSPDVFANNRLSLTMLSGRSTAYIVNLATGEGQQTASHMADYFGDSDYAHTVDPFHSAFGYSIRDSGFKGTFYEYMEAHPKRRHIFPKAMVGMSDIMGAHYSLQVYPWDGVGTVCDVGSGAGSFSRPLLQKYPHIHVTLFDLPGAIASAKDDLEAQFSDRVSFVEGDFFEEIRVDGCDVYYLRNVLHNWPEDRAKAILRSVQKAMKSQSRLLIHDPILRHMHPLAQGETTEAPSPLLPNYGAGLIRIYNWDLIMMIMWNARERTAAEVSELCRSVGFEFVRAWDLVEMGLLEFKLAA